LSYDEVIVGDQNANRHGAPFSRHDVRRDRPNYTPRVALLLVIPALVAPLGELANHLQVSPS
jgi:hypothetical protein